jgi:hypothetical protein
MEPNDLPIVCIPLELPAEAAAELLQFLGPTSRRPLSGITSASCSGSTKARRARNPNDSPFDRPESDPPF